MSTDDKRPEDNGADAEQENVTETSEEPLLSAAGAAKTAHKAVNETLDKYFAAVGLDLEEIQERICEKPILYMVISAGIGFVAGGGMSSKLGLTVLGFAGRRAATETATNFGHQVLRQASRGVRAPR